VLDKRIDNFHRKNVRLKIIGDYKQVSADIQDKNQILDGKNQK